MEMERRILAVPGREMPNKYALRAHLADCLHEGRNRNRGRSEALTIPGSMPA